MHSKQLGNYPEPVETPCVNKVDELEDVLIILLKARHHRSMPYNSDVLVYDGTSGDTYTYFSKYL